MSEKKMISVFEEISTNFQTIEEVLTYLKSLENKDLKGLAVDFWCQVVHTRLETDAEYNKRIKAEGKEKDKRLKKYLKLKAEFEKGE